jgi:DNA-binding HxlR family transcriptional regulator
MSDSDETEIAEFLGKKGAVGILSQIDRDDSNTSGELSDSVRVSGTTYSKRIDEALELDLLERVPKKPEDHGNVNRYQLTRRGKALRAELNSRGVLDTHQAVLDAIQDLEDEQEKLAEWATDADIADPDWPHMDSIPDDMR